MIVDTLTRRYEFTDPDAYIITLEGNEHSQKMSLRCQASCRQVGQPFYVWPAFDGTGDQLIYPRHLEGREHFTWIKHTNNKVTTSEIGCVMSHYSLWCHCINIDRPIVILEHDAVMLKRYVYHDGYNQINYLGKRSQLQEGLTGRIPPHYSIGWSNLFICCTHAYAIDPAVAKNLVAHLIKWGITGPADHIMRADIFNIAQDGLYAVEEPGELTIVRGDH